MAFTMTQLSDAIVLEVGHQQWRRMNVLRFKMEKYLEGDLGSRIAFLGDIATRVGRRIHDEALVDLDPILAYLRERLDKRRLALPDGYNITKWKLSTDKLLT